MRLLGKFLMLLVLIVVLFYGSGMVLNSEEVEGVNYYVSKIFWVTYIVIPVLYLMNHVGIIKKSEKKKSIVK